LEQIRVCEADEAKDTKEKGRGNKQKAAKEAKEDGKAFLQKVAKDAKGWAGGLRSPAAALRRTAEPGRFLKADLEQKGGERDGEFSAVPFSDLARRTGRGDFVGAVWQRRGKTKPEVGGRKSGVFRNAIRTD